MGTMYWDSFIPEEEVMVITIIEPDGEYDQRADPGNFQGMTLRQVVGLFDLRISSVPDPATWKVQEGEATVTFLRLEERRQYGLVA